ncbi:MAG: hypothetical protein LJE65_11000 [Desulfobacteraceae bacterium]|nr:hypothetical protein [Desulfobacteraceae bacterium]
MNLFGIMGLFEMAMIFSLIIALYNLQQIKMTLKDKGYPVDLMTGWLRDYRQFKGLIVEEPDQKKKLDYQGTLNGLHFSLLGIVIFGMLMLRNHI